ncbi:hypothetical protein [uncultured Haemophilus sp.]|nr:hypothetical protein [uncultured Haemophilus sp.]
MDIDKTGLGGVPAPFLLGRKKKNNEMGKNFGFCLKCQNSHLK